MAKSITRWNVSAQPLLKDPCLAAIAPYVTSGETDGACQLLWGPNDEPDAIPSDQYECYRTWTTTAGAQAWLDGIDAIAASVGCVCLEKRLEA